MEEWEHVDDFNLIDFSSENDNLYFSVSPLSNQHQFLQCQGDSTEFETIGHLPELAQSEERQRTRSGKYNLRQSLAWDNAFLTSAGVLDHEELTSMMDGQETPQKQFLPGIQEDMQRSTDSISTLESDNFTLESLEVELFADIRASIQKSNTTAKGSFGKKTNQKDGDQYISPPNWDSVSQNQLKSKPVLEKVAGLHKLGVSKCQPKVNTVIQGSMKAVKTEPSRSVVPRSAVTLGDSASTLARPPNGNSKSSSTTSSGTKVTSLGPSRLKTENGNAKTVSPRVSHESKISCSNGPCKSFPMSGSTSKSSSRKPSMAKTQFTRSSSKGASCDSPLSADEVKPPLGTVRRRAPSKAVNTPSPRTTPQSSSKNALKNKVTSDKSDLAAHLMSSEVPSSISPASSVSEWSSTSSSSAVNQKSNKSRSSIGRSSCRSEDGDALPFNIKAHTNNQITRCQEIKRSSASVKKSVLQAGVISSSTSMKPTGLRMPSPKIGYFDGVKSVHASCGAMQSHRGLPVALSKVGPRVSPRGISNIKHKASELPPGRIVTAKKHETQNPNAPLPARGNPQVPHNGDHEKQHPDAPLPAQGNPQVIPRNGDHEKKMAESPAKIKENGSEVYDEVSPKENLGVTKNEMMFVDPEHNESKTDEFSRKENIGVTKNELMLVDSEHNESNTDSCRLSTNAPLRLDAFKIDGHYDLGNSLNTCCIGVKENVPCKDRMDQSSKGVKSETVDLQTIEPLQVTCTEVS